MAEQMWHIHTVEYYLALKKEGHVLIHAIVGLAINKGVRVMLGEISQTQRPPTVGSHLFEMSRIGKSTQTQSKLVVAWGQGREG